MSFSNFGEYISGPCAFLHLPTSTTAATMATEDGHVASSDSEPEGEEFRDRTQSQPDDALVIGEFSSFKQAGDFVDCHSSYRFKVYHKSARVGAMITTYRQKCPDLC
ncbi:hypothetical protein F444_12200 [Phytophthora nicotianae P1976]|uniref:Uncharacterized protein n=1 Tax=Phytophthora nicotianae P1976 TaxID=1317066 RepID=A0A080ZXV7_PHYNI|nr:hypothetical protein F444_12200 [Phytophthora nicotianae P1976]